MAFSGARAYLTAPQSVSGYGTIAFAGVRYDTGPYWSAGSPTRLTVPASGTYRVGHWLHSWLYSDDWGTLQSAVLVNGSAVAAVASSRNFYAGDCPMCQFVTALVLSAGDYVEVQAYVNPSTTGPGHAARGYNTCLGEAWIARDR